MSTVEHPLIRPGVLEDRDYQRVIADHALRENVLAVLPTGLGKTAIALRLMAEWRRRDPVHSILMLAPTRPLVEQHARVIRETLVGAEPLVVTGMLTPERRAPLLAPPQIVVATPQVISNDVASGQLDLSTFSLMIVDEAHRAVGAYPYVTLGHAFRNHAGGRVLAMTASPGNRQEAVLEVLEVFGIDRASGLEFRTGLEPDVAPFLHAVKVDSVYVDSPAGLREVSQHLRSAFERAVEPLRRRGLVPDRVSVNRHDLLAARASLSAIASAARGKPGGADPGVWDLINAMAVAMKVAHALELSETQGIAPLRKYFERAAKGPKGKLRRSDRAFLKDADVEAARRSLETLDTEHPKVATVVRLVEDELIKEPGARIIVFAHYRDTAELLVRTLAATPSGRIRPVRFVGQATKGEDDSGLTQKEQVSRLEGFRHGDYNCLVATSVAEEGLDIPSTDLVIFYEPVPSEIRTIQRRGRTGRSHIGRAVILLTRGTRDITSQQTSRSKEMRMKTMLETIQGAARSPARSASKGPRRLEDFE